MSVNDQLMWAIEQHDVAEVHFLLEKGADPNYDSYAGKSEAEREGQPWSPLRMVVFRISDNLLEETHLLQYQSIARLLIEFGADPIPALELAERRYGRIDPEAENSFNGVLKFIRTAANKQ